MKPRAVNPASLAKPSGYSHGILAEEGRSLLFLAGQIGWDAAGRLEPGGLTAQFARALDNLLEVVREAGGGPENVVQLRIYLRDARDYAAKTREIGEAWRARMGRHYPAIALVQVAELLEAGALVEIEGMAVL